MKLKSILFLVATAVFIFAAFAAPTAQALIGSVIVCSLTLTALNLGGVMKPGNSYANTLTNLIPFFVRGFDVVSRELVGMLPGVNRDPSADRVAKNQTIYSWQTGKATLGNIAPSNVSPQAADKSIANVPITITNYKMSDFYFTGEEEKSLSSGGNGEYQGIVVDLVEQAIRAVVNQMEADCCTLGAVSASRATGTVGTQPYLTTVNASAQLRKILDDNGAPPSFRSQVVDTTAGANLRSLYQLTRANEAGTTMTLRDGELLNMHGMSIRESAQILNGVTVGTGANYTTDTAGYALGATAITLITGTGSILAGDIITISGDTNQYVVAVALVGAAPGVVTIAAPGLQKAIPTSAKAITVLAASTRALAFSKNAILFASRLPARPSGGDMASDVQTITDPRSGMSLELSMYPQYRQIRYEVAAAWQANLIKPEHIAQLIY